jgi:hypothetical protein
LPCGHSRGPICTKPSRALRVRRMPWPAIGAWRIERDHIMVISRHRGWTLAFLAGTLGIAAFGALALRSPPAQAQPASLIAPPACTCSAPVSVAGNDLLNCTCGALQCLVAGKGAAVHPALVCVK